MHRDTRKVRTLDRAEAERAEWREDFRALTEKARRFLGGFRWCGGIASRYAGIVIPGVPGVHLCEIVPAEPGVDDWLWVVVGDLPPAYLTLDDAPNPACAQDGYVGALRERVAAVPQGTPLEESSRSMPIPRRRMPTCSGGAWISWRIWSGRIRRRILKHDPAPHRSRGGAFPMDSLRMRSGCPMF